MDTKDATRSGNQKVEAEGKEPPAECCGAADIHERLDDGSERMDRIEASVQATRTDIAEVLEILYLAKSAIKIAGYIGSLVKWTAGIGAPIIAIYFSFRGVK